MEGLDKPNTAAGEERHRIDTGPEVVEVEKQCTHQVTLPLVAARMAAREGNRDIAKTVVRSEVVHGTLTELVVVNDR